MDKSKAGLGSWFVCFCETPMFLLCEFFTAVYSEWFMTVVVFNLTPLSTPQSLHKLKTNVLEGFLGTQVQNQFNKHYNHIKSYLLDTLPAWVSARDSSWSHIETL